MNGVNYVGEGCCSSSCDEWFLGESSVEWVAV